MRASTFIATALVASAASASPLVQRAGTPSSSAASAAAATALLGNPAASPNPVAEKGFVGMLRTAESTTDRFVALADEVRKGKADFKFDFNPAANPAVTPGAGGAVFNANRKTFPAVTDLGITGATLFFAPCGLNTPHTHPRASEFLTVATNSNILSGFVLENGAFNMEVNETLTQYQGMVFPQGSIHWQQNLDCQPAVAIAALNSDDPGASSVAQNFLKQTNAEIVQASIGFPVQISADNFSMLKDKIPAPFVKGLQSCFQKCGIKH